MMYIFSHFLLKLHTTVHKFNLDTAALKNVYFPLARHSNTIKTSVCIMKTTRHKLTGLVGLKCTTKPAVGGMGLQFETLRALDLKV